MNTKETIYSRKSTRKFLDKQIPKEDLIELMETASRTPSWTNNQPWEVFVVSGEKLDNIKKKYKTEFEAVIKSGGSNFARADIKMPGFDDWNDAPRSVENMVKFKETLALSSGYSQEEFKGVVKDVSTEFFYAPTVVFLGMNKSLTSYSMFDLGAFQQTLLLAAEEKNIDSCTAGLFAMLGDVLKEELEIPDNISIAIGIALGYGDKEAQINKREAMVRMPIDKFVRFHD